MMIGGGFMGFSAMFTIVFVTVILVFLAVAIKGLRQWNTNNHSPRLTVEATVVSKRTHHSRTSDHSSSSYYVTFQVVSGDRMELRVSGSDYGMMAEGDWGDLTFQGTRFVEFHRQLSEFE